MSYEPHYTYILSIQGVGRVSVYATTPYHAVDKAYSKYCDKQPDRAAYSVIKKLR